MLGRKNPLLVMFDVLANALNEMQGQESIGEAVEIWLDVVEKFPKGDTQGFISSPPPPLDTTFLEHLLDVFPLLKPWAQQSHGGEKG